MFEPEWRQKKQVRPIPCLPVVCCSAAAVLCRVLQRAGLATVYRMQHSYVNLEVPLWHTQTSQQPHSTETLLLYLNRHLAYHQCFPMAS
jgi:hypothetical protein